MDGLETDSRIGSRAVTRENMERDIKVLKAGKPNTVNYFTRPQLIKEISEAHHNT